MTTSFAWHVEPWGGATCGVASARRTFDRRDGLVVALRDASGVLGFGEATPLPGFGDDDLERARAELRPEALPAPVDELESVDAVLARFRSPSARFAVETALLDRIARRRGLSLSGLLGASSDGVLRSVLVGALSDDGFLTAARAAAARGARSVKLKAQGRDLAEESRRLSELGRALRPGVRVRLDLNGSLDASGAREALAVYARANVELCEEPTSGTELRELGAEATPWFADESAHSAELSAAFVAHPGCAGIVLKPTLVGGLGEAHRRARAAFRAGKSVLVTHAFEGPIALAAAAELALSIGGALAHGIDRHAALSAFPELELAQLPEQGSPLAVVRSTKLGLGVHLEDPWLRSS